MKIEYIYEAGVFESYKKANAQSNIDNAKKELTRDAQKSIIESKCDDLAELFLDMLNDVSLETSAVSNKYNYKTGTGTKEKYNFLELSNCIVNRNFKMCKSKEMQLNIIKNIYCNRPAIEYMVSNGCFILPLVDTTDFYKYMNNDSKDIIPYKNMTKTIADAAEKVIKLHLSKFPSYVSVIPNKVKIVILRDMFDNNYLRELDYSETLESFKDSDNIIERKLLSYMGFTNKGVIFKYPGKGNSCLKCIIDNCTLLVTHSNITPTKENAPILKAMADPSPWMFNKLVTNFIRTDLSTVIANNFYGIKLLKFAVDKGVLVKKYKEYPSSLLIYITMKDVIKNIKYIKALKQEISNNGLDDYITYEFRDADKRVESYMAIGKELSAEQAEQEGIIIDDIKRRVYEFDYNNSTEIESVANDIIKSCGKFLTGADDSIKQLIETKVKKSLPVIIKNIYKSKPNCISSSNKILLCDIFKDDAMKCNLLYNLLPDFIELNENGNLVVCIGINFMVVGAKGYSEYIPQQIKIEIPLI